MTRPRQLLTVGEVAAQLRISRSALYRLINDGEIASMRVGNCRRFTSADVESYITRQLEAG